MNNRKAKISRTQTKIYPSSIYNNDRIILDGYTELAGKKNLRLHYSIGWRDVVIPIETINNIDGKAILFFKEGAFVDSEFSDIYHPIGNDVSFYMENDISFLDEEGEFCYENGYLYYMLYDNESISTIKTYIPSEETILNILGNDISSPVKNIEFSNITFENTSWDLPYESGYSSMQSQWLNLPKNVTVPACVSMNYCENVNFMNCSFRNLGAVGINAIYGVIKCNFISNLFYNISQSAIVVGDYNDSDENSCTFTQDIKIAQNYIDNIGDYYFSSPAISVFYTRNIDISKNTIKNIPYSGISIGWGWDITTSSKIAKNNSITNNYIENFMMECIDGGGIYLLGQQPNSVIKENYIKNQFNNYGGIYFDQGTSGYVVYNNILENCFTPFYAFSKSATNNIAYNNYATNSLIVNNGNNNFEKVNLYLPYGESDIIKEIKQNSGSPIFFNANTTATFGNEPYNNAYDTYNVNQFKEFYLKPIIDNIETSMQLADTKYDLGKSDELAVLIRKSRNSINKKELLQNIYILKEKHLDFITGKNIATGIIPNGTQSLTNYGGDIKKLTDNNPNSFWEVYVKKGEQAHFTIDLKNYYEIDKISILFRTNYNSVGVENERGQFSILVSNDENFNTFKTVGGIYENSYNHTEFVVKGMENEKYRYVRYITNVLDGAFYHLVGDIKVYPKLLDSQIQISDIIRTENKTEIIFYGNGIPKFYDIYTVDYNNNKVDSIDFLKFDNLNFGNERIILNTTNNNVIYIWERNNLKPLYKFY